ncbi:hypothetical protein ACLB2K_066752 [Fragaria x ananassa]
MNVLAWNCQGIVNRETLHALKLLVQQHQMHMIFLSETHCTAVQHNSLKKAIGLPNMIQVERKERAGGLVLLWNETMQVSLRSAQYFFIDVDVVSEEDIYEMAVHRNLWSSGHRSAPYNMGSSALH